MKIQSALNLCLKFPNVGVTATSILNNYAAAVLRQMLGYVEAHLPSLSHIRMADGLGIIPVIKPECQARVRAPRLPFEYFVQDEKANKFCNFVTRILSGACEFYKPRTKFASAMPAL